MASYKTTTSGVPSASGTYTDTLTFALNTNINVSKGYFVQLNGESTYYRLIKDMGEGQWLVHMMTNNGKNLVRNSRNYVNSSVDTYMNSTFYNSLSQNIKNAIVPQTVSEVRFQRYTGSQPSGDYLF